ncbi:MAG: hypothetical protein EGR16_09395 [Clostridiales bacterium]|nr:hypothetical protein [Clostridiales bacterium]
MCIGGIDVDEVISLKSKEKLDYLAIIIEIYLLEEYCIADAVDTNEYDGVYFINIKKEYFDKAAEAVSEWIVRSSGVFFIFDIMDEELNKLPVYLKYEIISRINEKLYSKEAKAITTDIKQLLVNFSTDASIISYDGFMMFSAGESIISLYEILYKAFKEFEAELEYNRIVDLLRIYIESESFLSQELNVIANNGEYLFYDENGENITSQCKTEFISEFGNNMDSDDILLEVIIQRLPKRINIYCEESDNFKNIFITIKELFGNRVLMFDLSEFVIKL